MEPSQVLVPDEYCRISIDYNYSETNTSDTFSACEPQFTLPVSLYGRPICGVFK